MKVGNDPDALLKLSKKGKTLMTFVKVSPKYQKEEVEKITKLWQSSLWNNHIQAERYEKFNVFLNISLFIMASIIYVKLFNVILKF